MNEFHVPEECLRTLTYPSEFYESLLKSCNSSISEVSLSSLYLGTGALEISLAHKLRERLVSCPSLRLNMTFDLNRAIRKMKPVPREPGDLSSNFFGRAANYSYSSSAELLLELFRDVNGTLVPSLGRRIDISMVLIPSHRGILGRLVSARYVEGIGVWHVKAYVFDRSTVILTGANLSSDYFTTRQDRYVVISCANGEGGEEGARSVGALADYVHSTLKAVSSLPGSYALNGMGVVCSGRKDGLDNCDDANFPEDTKIVSLRALPTIQFKPLPLFSPKNLLFSSGLKDLLIKHSCGVVQEHPETGILKGNARRSATEGGRTVTIRPRWQLGSLGVRCDELQLQSTLQSLGPAQTQSLYLATGYFNLPVSIQRLLISARGACIHVLTAAPTANGFWGAKGVAGAIPLAYCQLEKTFYDAVSLGSKHSQDPEGSPLSPGITIHEYSRPGWTFHAKGLWLLTYPRAPHTSFMRTLPSRITTLVGSSNFGQRGLQRDLELQFEISSSDNSGTGRLFWEEADNLFAFSQRQAHNCNASHNHWIKAVGPHLARGVTYKYGPERDVWCPKANPHRALQWRASWSNGIWIKAGKRILAGFF